MRPPRIRPPYKFYISYLHPLMIIMSTMHPHDANGLTWTGERTCKGVLTGWGITPLFDVPQLTPVFQLSFIVPGKPHFIFLVDY